MTSDENAHGLYTFLSTITFRGTNEQYDYIKTAIATMAAALEALLSLIVIMTST
jgi:hypothetical protein